MPDLEGGVITADALHLEVDTIAQVVEDKNGHILVGLKGNRSRLLNEVTDAFAQSDLRQQSRDRDVYFGHGRIETRIADVIPFQTTEKYPYISTAVRIKRTRIQKKDNNTAHATSYYVGTFEFEQFTAAQIQGLVRGHWAIENKLHHVKDRTMQEDRCQARANVGTNMALLRSVVSQMKARAKKQNKRVSGKLRGNAAYAIELVMQTIDYQNEKRIE
jgi:predicted transposase YbfD/YdcC